MSGCTAESGLDEATIGGSAPVSGLVEAFITGSAATRGLAVAFVSGSTVYRLFEQPSVTQILQCFHNFTLCLMVGNIKSAAANVTLPLHVKYLPRKF